MSFLKIILHIRIIRNGYFILPVFSLTPQTYISEMGTKYPKKNAAKSEEKKIIMLGTHQSICKKCY